MEIFNVAIIRCFVIPPRMEHGEETDVFHLLPVGTESEKTRARLAASEKCILHRAPQGFRFLVQQIGAVFASLRSPAATTRLDG